jgi:hypothetical protein
MGNQGSEVKMRSLQHGDTVAGIYGALLGLVRNQSVCSPIALRISIGQHVDYCSTDVQHTLIT